LTAPIEARRLADLDATILRGVSEEALDHYPVVMKDPEGDEFNIN
jgi:hypothetical protein